MATNKVITAISSVKITNTYSATAFEPLSLLAGTNEEDVWNTGLSAIETEDALVTDVNPVTAKHIAAIKLFRNNSYLFIAPGDSVTLTTSLNEEVVYYEGLSGDLISVEVTVPTGEGD